MKPFEASSPNVEVNGETVLAVLAGMGAASTRATRILAAHGIENPKPGQWIKQQSWLDAFKEISETLGPNTLFQIGLKIPEQAKFPPEIKSIEQALTAINMAYQMNHRGGEIGSYVFEPLAEGKFRMVCRNPYPSDFDRGIIQAMANRFKPQGKTVAVELDTTKPSRKNGGESCTFNVKC
jgi:hypothetical protein